MGRSPAGAGTSWSRSQLDLNFSLCVQRPSDLLLQQGVGSLQSLVLHGQLPEPQLRLLLGHALDRCTEMQAYLGPRGGEPGAPPGKGPAGCTKARVHLRGRQPGQGLGGGPICPPDVSGETWTRGMLLLPTPTFLQRSLNASFWPQGHLLPQTEGRGLLRPSQGPPGPQSACFSKNKA